MKNHLLALTALLLAFSPAGFSQGDLTVDLPYEVHRVYPPLSITKEKLKEALTLIDLNPRYPSSWINEYIAVEISAGHQGKVKKAVNKNNLLSREQKELLNKADLGTDLVVKVRYLPDNTLTHNDVKEINFSFTVEPENDAEYPGGQGQQNWYLKEKAMDQIPDGLFTGYDLAAVKFTIDEAGRITDAHVFWPSKDEKTDALLLETICNMPNWKPAAYADGTTVKQEFVLTVGNMENCAIHLLNIRGE